MIRNPNKLMRTGLLAAATLAGALALPACSVDDAPFSMDGTPARLYEDSFGHRDYGNGLIGKNHSQCLGFTEWSSRDVVVFESGDEIVVDPKTAGIDNLVFVKEDGGLSAADDYTESVLSQHSC